MGDTKKTYGMNLIEEEIFDLDRLIRLEKEPDEYSFCELQHKAWNRHCLMRSAFRMRNQVEKLYDIPNKLRLAWLNNCLNELEKRGAIDLDGERFKRFDPDARPHDDTIFKWESILPGTAETFFYGPDGSYLWPAMKGEDHRGIAIKRFLDRSGLEANDLYNLDVEFFIQFTLSYPRLMISCLAAFISLSFLQHPELKSSNASSPLQFLRIDNYLHLSGDALYSHVGMNDSILIEQLKTLKVRPEVKNTFQLLMSHEIADALAFYGIHNQALHSVTGKLRYPPSLEIYKAPSGEILNPESSAKAKKLLHVDPFARYHKLPKIMVANTIDKSSIPKWLRFSDKNLNDPMIPAGVLARSNWLEFGSVFGPPKKMV